MAQAMQRPLKSFNDWLTAYPMTISEVVDSIQYEQALINDAWREYLDNPDTLLSNHAHEVFKIELRTRITLEHRLEG